VVPGVVQHVDERCPDFAGAAKSTRVEAIGENASMPAPESVEDLGDSDEQALHPARESLAIRGFGDPVDVVRLEGEVDQTEFEPLARRGERLLDRAPRQVTAETGQLLANSNRDVDGMARVVRWTFTMRHACTSSTRFATGASTGSAPRAEAEFVLARE
jgi:hypothetical protein